MGTKVQHYLCVGCESPGVAASGDVGVQPPWEALLR